MKCGSPQGKNCMAYSLGLCMEYLFTDTPICKSRIPLTQADRIRAMTDEELAKDRIRGGFYWRAYDIPNETYYSKEEAVAAELAWLRSPAEERKDDDKS